MQRDLSREKTIHHHLSHRTVKDTEQNVGLAGRETNVCKHQANRSMGNAIKCLFAINKQKLREIEIIPQNFGDRLLEGDDVRKNGASLDETVLGGKDQFPEHLLQPDRN